jgi:hypothetical protein
MPEAEDYKKFLTDFIQKQMVVLGPNIALDKAKKVPGLTIDSSGQVKDLAGDPQLVIKAAAKEYLALSEAVTKMVLSGLLEKYPAVKALKLIEK